MISLSATAQTEPESHSRRNLPYPLVRNPEPRRYNLKWRHLMARFQASVSAEISDNIDLAGRNPEADVSFGPNIGVGLFWPITQVNMLQLDMGLGYHWFLDHPSIQTVSVAPASRLDYWIYFDEGRINFHDNFSVLVEPTSRPDLNKGSDDNPSNFRRLNNTSGFTAEWRPIHDLSLVGGYDYTLDRSLSGQFTQLDRNDHTFSAASYYDVSSRFTAGLSGSATLTYYQEAIHNDAVGYSFGPVVILEPSQFITIDASVNYSITTFDSTGSLSDTSHFHGVTGQMGLRHTINSWLSHEARASRGRDFAVGSNFYDIINVRYGIHARLNRACTLHTQVLYEHFRTSGNRGERADRYGLYLSTAFQLDRHWSLILGYNFTSKESNQSDRDYTQNRVSLDLTRQF